MVKRVVIERKVDILMIQEMKWDANNQSSIRMITSNCNVDWVLSEAVIFYGGLVCV